MATAKQYLLTGILLGCVAMARAHTRSPGTDSVPDYILYWGAYIIKPLFHPDAATLVHRDTISPVMLREIMRRQPRLWTGNAMQREFRFTTGNLVVTSDAADASVYRSTRAELEAAWAYLLPSDSVVIKAELPGGRTLLICWALSGKPPEWSYAHTGEFSWQYDPIKFRGHFPETVIQWGNRKESVFERQFITQDELFDWLWQEPVSIRKQGQWLAVTDISVFFPYADKFPLPDYSWRAIQSLPSLREWLYSIQSFLQPGTGMVITAIAQDNWPRDTFLMGYGENRGKQLIQKINIDIMAVQLAAPGDECLQLRRSDLRNYEFEWGNYAAVIPKKYAQKYDTTSACMPDKPETMEITGFSVAEIVEMLNLHPRIYQDQILLSPVRLSVRYNNDPEIWEYGPGGLPDHWRTKLAHLKSGDRLTVYNLMAASADLSSLQFIFIVN